MKHYESQTLKHYYYRGFYIVDIHRQLQLKDKQLSDGVELYGDQLMSDDELKRLQSLRGQLISVNSFFSTSTVRDETRRFLQDKLGSPHVRHRVLFIIVVDLRVISNTRYADISKRSHYPEENEV